MFHLFKLKKSAQWVIEGDIKACFDKIGHQWLMNHIAVYKRILEQWLKSGSMDKGLFYRTNEGTAHKVYRTKKVCESQLYWIRRRFHRHLCFKGSAGERY